MSEENPRGSAPAGSPTASLAGAPPSPLRSADSLAAARSLTVASGLLKDLWEEKDAAALEYWAKDLAPSTELRKWFHHEPRPWEEFRRRYVEELRQNEELLTQLRERACAGRITLIYASRDESQNDAVVLRDILLGR